MNCIFNKTFSHHMYLIYMYQEDLALNKLHMLICHKTKPNQCVEVSC